MIRSPTHKQLRAHEGSTHEVCLSYPSFSKQFWLSGHAPRPSGTTDKYTRSNTKDRKSVLLTSSYFPKLCKLTIPRNYVIRNERKGCVLRQNHANCSTTIIAHKFKCTNDGKPGSTFEDPLGLWSIRHASGQFAITLLGRLTMSNSSTTMSCRL